MRPPILEWKVSLALIGVVVVAVTLGSVLHSTPKHENKLYAVVTLQRATPLVATPIGPTAIKQCKAFKAELRTAPPADKPALRMLTREICHKGR